MGSKLKHEPGTFCWAELSTTDTAGAKGFYSDLMGWETHDDPVPGGGVYTMLREAEGDVGALFQITEEMKAQGVPPNWMGYVTVDNAAEAAAKAKELGGAVLKEAFDVMDVGAMAVIADPAGAVLALWQPKQHCGFDHNDARPGTVCWNELMTRDAAKAGEFYAKLFGWEREDKDMGPMGIYTIFKRGEVQLAGMMQMTEQFGDMPSHWLIYFAVADCDASADKVEALGGNVRVPPTDIPDIGRFAVAQDPQGAAFSFIKLQG